MRRAAVTATSSAGKSVSRLSRTTIFHGTAPAVESTPRFATAYVPAGFSDYIARTGHILPDFDARFYIESFRRSSWV